jgi:hypothetical protein
MNSLEVKGQEERILRTVLVVIALEWSSDLPSKLLIPNSRVSELQSR